MDIAKRIIFLREQKRYTTNKLALKAGISQSFLRDLELANKKPTVETIRVLCETLGISLRDFFDEETENAIMNDNLLRAIYRLTPEQRLKLTEFLELLDPK